MQISELYRIIQYSFKLKKQKTSSSRPDSIGLKFGWNFLN